jgi:hypothetical protein
MFGPEDRGDMFLRNIGCLSPGYTELTNCMELSLSCEAVVCAATQGFPNILQNSTVHHRVHKRLPLEPFLRPSPRPFVTFLNKIVSYGENLLASRSTPPKLEDHPCTLSATACSIYSQVSSIHSLRTRHAVVTRVPLNVG